MQGPASAAVEAVVSAPGSGPGLCAISPPQSRLVAEESSDVQVPLQHEHSEITEADVTDFLAYNVIMDPDIASGSNFFVAEGSGTNTSDMSGGGVLSIAVPSRADDSDVSSTDVHSSGVPRSRHGRWRCSRGSRPQSAPVGAPSLVAWDDALVETSPSFELSGLRTGVPVRARK